MKAENLRILKEKGFPVPPFIVVESETDEGIQSLPEKRYAVRSSADLEDGDEKSYAGQFLTELNVEKSCVRDAVKRVLDSGKAMDTMMSRSSQTLMNPIPETGKKHGSAMKVIIQEMVDAEYSGVLFTANPLGILNESVVVIGKGLGENVVEDRCDTTSYYYNLDDDLFYYEKQDDALLVKNEIIKCIVDTGKRIKALFKKNMDIEFAVKDDEVYVLQARPITTLSYSRKIVLDNSNIVESYPGVSLPMTHSFVKEIYRDIFRAMVKRLTGNDTLVKKMEPVFQNMVREANGRVYYDITNWYNILSILPFSNKIISVWQEMLGVSNKEISVDFHAGFFEKGHVLFSFLKYLHTTPEEMEKLNSFFSERYPVYMKRIEEYSAGKPDCDRTSPDSDSKINKGTGKADGIKDRSDARSCRSEYDSDEGISGLLKIYKDIEKELIPLWDITLVNDMYAFIYTYLAGRRHPEEIAHISKLASMRPVESLNRLIRLQKKNLDHSGICTEGDSVNCKAESGRSKNDDEKDFSIEYLKERQSYIQTYGDRCLEELKLETRTYRTDPQLLDEYIRIHLMDKMPEESEQKIKESKSLFVKRAKVGISNREISRMNRTRIFGMVRSIMLKIGEILKKQGKISEVRDVFFLTLEELREDAEGRNISNQYYDDKCEADTIGYKSEIVNELRRYNAIDTETYPDASDNGYHCIDFMKLVRERKIKYEGFKKIPAYSRLVYGDKVMDKFLSEICTDTIRDHSVLRGIPSSPGIVRGEVLLIDKADQKLDTGGKIIVTRMTDPGWIFLIKPALGIIAEKGSMLSHTAIITRELGKPSVVNVRGAASLLKTGDIVELNACEGTVTRIGST